MRYLKLSTLFMLVSAFGVGLGALPQEAAAGKVCQKLKLADNCVVGSDVRNLKAGDIKDEAGAAFASGTSIVALTSSDKVIKTVTLTAPRPGIVIVTASGFFRFNAGSQTVGCSISTDNSMDTPSEFGAENDNLISFLPWASVQAYEVQAGNFTANVVCAMAAGTQTDAINTSMVAQYMPTLY